MNIAALSLVALRNSSSHSTFQTAKHDVETLTENENPKVRG